MYSMAFDFSDGLAAIKINGKYGFIDHEGHFVLEPVYEKAQYFYEGLAPVQIGEK